MSFTDLFDTGGGSDLGGMANQAGFDTSGDNPWGGGGDMGGGGGMSGFNFPGGTDVGANTMDFTGGGPGNTWSSPQNIQQTSQNPATQSARQAQGQPTSGTGQQSGNQQPSWQKNLSDIASLLLGVSPANSAEAAPAAAAASTGPVTSPSTTLPEIEVKPPVAQDTGAASTPGRQNQGGAPARGRGNQWRDYSGGYTPAGYSPGFPGWGGGSAGSYYQYPNAPSGAYGPVNPNIYRQYNQGDPPAYGTPKLSPYGGGPSGPPGPPPQMPQPQAPRPAPTPRRRTDDAEWGGPPESHSDREFAGPPPDTQVAQNTPSVANTPDYPGKTAQLPAGHGAWPFFSHDPWDTEPHSDTEFAGPPPGAPGGPGTATATTGPTGGPTPTPSYPPQGAGYGGGSPAPQTAAPGEQAQNIPGQDQTATPAPAPAPAAAPTPDQAQPPPSQGGQYQQQQFNPLAGILNLLGGLFGMGNLGDLIMGNQAQGNAPWINPQTGQPYTDPATGRPIWEGKPQAPASWGQAPQPGDPRYGQPPPQGPEPVGHPDTQSPQLGQPPGTKPVTMPPPTGPGTVTAGTPTDPFTTGKPGAPLPTTGGATGSWDTSGSTQATPSQATPTPPPNAVKTTKEAAIPPGAPTGGATAPGQATTRGSYPPLTQRMNSGRNAEILNGVNPALQDTLAAGASQFEANNPGYKVVVNSGRRGSGQGAHTSGNAVDLQIIDPSGRAIPNSGADRTGKYTELARYNMGAMQAFHPELRGKFAWGGYFGANGERGYADPRTGANNPDLMHFDLWGQQGFRGDMASRYYKLGPQGNYGQGTPAPATNQPPRTAPPPGTSASRMQGNTRGDRNNNPGNIKGRGWPGQTGSDAQGHAIFSSPQAGAQAQAALLQRRYNHMTVPQMNRAGYATDQGWARNVMRAGGFGPNEVLNLDDPATMARLQRAIWQAEGTHPPPDVLAYIQSRQGGGPVQAGQPYMVGEKGPEIVVPQQSGTVVSNQASKGDRWDKNQQQPGGGSFWNDPATAAQQQQQRWRQRTTKGGKDPGPPVPTDQEIQEYIGPPTFQDRWQGKPYRPPSYDQNFGRRLA